MKFELKNLLHSSHTIDLSKSTIFAKKCRFFRKKNADISKIRRTFVLKRIFSETKYLCVLAYEISSF